ncbi:MAG: PKD domain-containing protein [Bacteroidales bacterium]|nr:PKD domain-containing protein [Bacteroidales bacterium]
MKTSLINFSTVLACLLLSTYSKAQSGFTDDYDGISCPPVTVTFTNIEYPAPGDYFLWWFASDGPYAVLDTSYTFTQGGYYGIRMEHYNSLGNLLGAWNNDLNINGASIYISADNACPGDEIYFELQTQEDVDDNQILWDFGDGNSTYGWNVNHAYGSIGTYEVTLITDVGCGIDTVTQSVTIGNAVTPAANINVWPNPSCPNDVINFEAWNSAGSFSWVFGDGNDTTTTDTRIDHSYTATGNYTVKMAVTNGCGLSDSTTSIVYVQNGLPFTDQVNLSVKPDTACPGDGVLFDSWDINDYAGFMWNFGDGSPIDSTNTSPIHYYSASGTYPITLTVINGCGNPGVFYDTVVITNNVVPDPAEYEYGFMPFIACPTDSIMFFSQGGAASYFWDFGDGNTGSEVPFLQGTMYVGTSHAYTDTGTYAVAFTLTNGCGLSFTDTFNVYISNSAPYFVSDNYPAFYWDGFETGTSATCKKIEFGVLVGGSTFSWDWGDGDTTLTNASNTTHRYNSPGTYLISLFVQNSCGDTATFTNNITITGICPLLTATASGTGPTCTSLADGSATVTVSNGLSPYTYLWDDPAEQTTATATGLSEGTYSVIVTDAAGDKASATVTLTSGYEVSVSIDNIIDATCGGNDGVAIASATGGVSPYIYQWSNGVIGAVDTALSAGYYIVTATDANGCNNFAQATVSDHNGPVITVASTTDADCNSSSGGAIDIFISQGTTPYTFLWSNGSITEDVSNLTAGPYEVTVTDANGCVGLKSILIAGQETFTLTTTTTSANCGSSNGSATVNISGGASPFTYLWSSGGTDSTEINLAAGVYTVTVTDANGCVGSTAAAVSNINSPSLAVDSITDAVCGGTGGAIYVTVTGGTPAYAYLWSNASTNQDLINASVGVYDIEVTDANNCIATASFEISMVPTPKNQICLVTVDSVTQTNLVVWEKPAVQGGIESYNIYKESSQAGVYFLIGNQIYADPSEFNDIISDPKVRSWRYKLSVVDACGNESDLSEPHKTMHLTQNVGLNNTVNLIWDHYEGFDFSTYEIYRYSSVSGWEKLDGIASDLTSYTDLTPPSSGLYYYVVKVVRPSSCTSTRKVGTHNSSRSNRTTDQTTGIKSVAGNMSNLGIYPNPSNGVFTLTFDMKKKEDVAIRMFDITGRLVHSIQYKNYSGTFRKNLDLSELGSGLYLFQIVSETGIVYTQIVIE